MTTVIRRTFRATPRRDAHATWAAIVDLLTRGQDGDARRALMAVSGTAASLIADQAPKDEAITVTCDGPRTRIYCLYDDDAVDGSDANEDSLSYDPLKGSWQVSLPCADRDLTWVRRALARQGAHISARGPSEAPAADEGVVPAQKAAAPLRLDPKGFLGQ